jgi:drug/metabolite transporter (DMT)-like permease
VSAVSAFLTLRFVLLGVSRAVLFPAVVPAVSVIVGIPIVCEIPSLLQIAGLMLVTAGLLTTIGVFRTPTNWSARL